MQQLECIQLSKQFLKWWNSFLKLQIVTHNYFLRDKYQNFSRSILQPSLDLHSVWKNFFFFFNSEKQYDGNLKNNNDKYTDQTKLFTAICLTQMIPFWPDQSIQIWIVHMLKARKWIDLNEAIKAKTIKSSLVWTTLKKIMIPNAIENIDSFEIWKFSCFWYVSNCQVIIWFLFSYFQ